MSLPPATLERMESMLRATDSAIRRDGDVLRRTYSNVVIEVACRQGILAVTAVSTRHLTDQRDLRFALDLVAGPAARRMIAVTSLETSGDGGRVKAVHDSVISEGATDTQLLETLQCSMDVCASTIMEYDAKIAEMAAERREEMGAQ